MKSGLLCYDADPRKPLRDKIEEAAQRYYEKFGVRPNTCFVNPSALPSVQPAASSSEAQPISPVPTLQVSARSTILPNHIWLGVSAS